jgi:hypothetical protein
MYWRAWRLRDEMRLNETERIATRGSLRGHLLSIAIGVLSLLFALSVPSLPALSGVVYFLMGPVQGINGYLVGCAIEEVEQSASRRQEIAQVDGDGAAELAVIADPSSDQASES